MPLQVNAIWEAGRKGGGDVGSHALSVLKKILEEELWEGAPWVATAPQSLDCLTFDN